MFLSTVLRENFSSFRTLHNFMPYYAFLNVWNWSLLRSKGKVQNWVRRRSDYLNLCEAHGLNTWGQLPHLMKKWQKIRYSVQNFVFLVVQGFIDSFFMLYFTYVSYIVIAGPWNFIMCPATIRSENMSEQAWGDLLQAPVTERRISTGRPVTAWIGMRKDVTGKEFTLTSWRAEIAKCRRTRTSWTLCWRRTGEAIPRAAKLSTKS